MDLFSASGSISHEPLAARMRPRNLDEYVGQDHIIGPGRLLRRAIQADQLSSVIFYGPPGTGKTTLARVIANHTKSNFVTLNAVLAGVQQIRESIAQADDQRKLYQRRTILFVDEVHRWNRAQQDALLPWVENGTIILIGATTENPFFEVNKALVSRSRVFQLKALTPEDLTKAALAAIGDRERGYGKWKVTFTEGALEHLVETASGDARSLLNALELAVETSVPKWPPAEGSSIEINREAAEESIQQKVVLYDRDGDYHYDVISAFIKSLRGRDPDAALYWLARMVRAGESPAFIFRRMLISACEDTGLADPHAISVVESCAAAFDRIGFPEGNFHLTHAALYLATAPKSNSAMAFFDAIAAVEKEDAEVPNHLRDGNRDAEGFGHGQGYLYPHSYREHWVAQQYLPDPLVGRVFYTPSVQGYEGSIRDAVLSRRELQVAEILEQRTGSGNADAGKDRSQGAYDAHYFGAEGKTARAEAPRGEILTFSPDGKRRDEWTRRADSGRSETLLSLRDEITKRAGIARHHRVLAFGADDGLLVWEAGRLAPEGLTVGLCRSEEAKLVLEQYARTLDELDRPRLETVNEGEPFSVPDLGYAFDRIIARDPAGTLAGIGEFAASAAERLAAGGRLVFSVRCPALGMRLSRLCPDAALAAEAATAEAALFDSGQAPFDWDTETLGRSLAAVRDSARAEEKKIREPRRVFDSDIERWLDPASAYGAAIAAGMDSDGREAFRQELLRAVRNGPVRWEYSVLLCVMDA